MGARRRMGAVLVAAATAATTVLGVGVTGSASHSAPGAPGGRAAPADGDVGSWQVRSLGDGRYDVSWRSPSLFPLTSDRPTITGPADLLISVPTIAEDGRTVQAIVTSATPPTPDELDVVLSGDRLDEVGDDPVQAGAAAAELDLPGTITLDEDPATPGPYEVTTSDYDLDPVKLPRMRQPIEMVGHVVEPVADAETGPRPLVLFMHGRHSVCYDPSDENGGGGEWPCQPPEQEIPSHLGYDYAQQVLASQGYATVSVRVNGINAQDYRLDDGGADARATVVEEHLQHWVGLAAEHQVDMDRVVLVGHSRGGEGVDRASIQIPLSAPYRIAGQVLIAPTDFAAQTAPYVPTVTMLPFCDGDVFDLQGQQFTDTSRDLTTGDTSLKSSVLVMGANHNFFNTEWTPGQAVAPAWDDWGGARKAECGSRNPDRLSATEQQAVGAAYVAGAVHLFADGDQDVLPLFDGTRARVDSIGDAQVLSHTIGGGRDVRAPDRDLARALPDGASTRMCQGVTNASRIASCASSTEDWAVWPHWTEPGTTPTRSFFEMSWDAPGQSGGVLLEEPLDLAEDRLELRTIVDPAAGDVDLRVRITDADGATALLTPAGGGTLPGLGESAETRKYWAQTLVVDPAEAEGVDLTRIEQVDLVSASERGQVWVADLAAAPAELAAVPDVRLPTVNLGRAEIVEGNGSKRVTAAVPFTVVGDVTRPARLMVTTVGQLGSERQRFTIDLAPGQTEGSIPVRYQPDRRDDYDKLLTYANAFAAHNVMTDAYIGQLVVVDDDPAPRLRVKAVKRTIAEGQTARLKVTLSAPVDYDLYITGRIVRSPKPALAADDVPRKWFRSYTGQQPKAGTPLWTYRPTLYDHVFPGRKAATLSVPTVRDDRDEGRESLRVRVSTNGGTVTRTIWVR